MVDRIFNRVLLKQNRVRALENYEDHNFLIHEIANRIIEDIDNLGMEFNSVLEVDAMDGYLIDNLKVKQKTICNEDDLNYPDESFDLLVSNLNMHFINDIPKFLVDARRVLKNDGVFIASFFGEENLSELAHVLHLVQNEYYGGVSPIMPPTIDIKTSANLVQKAGFSSPISNFEKIEVMYKDVVSLFKDIKYMGQGNILHEKSKRFFTRGFLDAICKKYFDEYSDSSGKAKATFEVVTIMGRK